MLLANPLFPVFLKLEQLRVLLVGGGNVGLEKLTAILRNSPGTAVTVVSLTFLPALRTLAARHPAVQLHVGPYDDAYLVEADVVFAATDDPALHRRIKAAARARRLLVNVADTPALCDFYLSSVVQKGALKMVVSTNKRAVADGGQAPARRARRDPARGAGRGVAKDAGHPPAAVRRLCPKSQSPRCRDGRPRGRLRLRGPRHAPLAGAGRGSLAGRRDPGRRPVGCHAGTPSPENPISFVRHYSELL